MKRPDGFARPASVPEPAPTPPTAREPRAPRARKPVQGPRNATGGSAAGAVQGEPDSVTEPITVIPPTQAATRAAAPAATQPSTQATTPATTPAATQPVKPHVSPVTPITRLTAAHDAAVGSVTGAGGSGTERAASAEQAPPPVLSSWQARKRLWAAKRARKRYEREEVRRFTWRARKRRRSIWIALGIAMSLIAFVIVGAYSPLMALRTIEVTGTNRIPATDIQSALDDQLGTPLPLIDFGAVKDELATFPLIRSFVTESRPPNTLVVRIVERDPVGLVTTDAGFDLLDAAGVVIESSAERPAGYPVIEAEGGISSHGFRAAAAVISALPESIHSQLDTVSAATADDVTLGLVGGARVVWGNAERSEFKGQVLGALMISNPVGSVAEYDVSSPDSAVLR